jgi:Uma2 family endonuclease
LSERCDRMKGLAKVALALACLLDVYVLFADGSLKRPDISLFCHRPAERDTAFTSVPKAVIEVLSPGFEAKDLQFGPAFYLSQGVLDVLVFDPLTNTAYHFTSGGVERRSSPTTVHFAMGCRVDLPLMD